MTKTIPFASYIFKRLQQLNCFSIHGVPGDFFLRALDHIEPNGGSGTKWIGNASELCAGYAADGYARAAMQVGVRKHPKLPFNPAVGALFTTYGVGELSAMNAVAGSYAESIPVVHLVGTPSRRAMANGDPRRPIHHSLGDGNMEIWAEMAKKITCAQAYLHREPSGVAAAERFDSVLEQAVLKSKPVYASIPSDLIDEEVPVEMLETPLRLELPTNDQKTENMLIEQLVEKIRSAKSPLIIADGLSYPLRLRESLNELVKITGFRAMSCMSGKGVIEEDGNACWDPRLPNTTNESRNADFVMYFGPLLADTNTARWSAIPASQDNVYFNLDTVQVNDQTYNIRSLGLLTRLLERLKYEKLEPRIDFMDIDALEELRSECSDGRPRSYQKGDKVSQDDFWSTVSAGLNINDLVLLANGTPLLGGRRLRLDEGATVIASSIWCSIGQMLPAAQGAAAALKDFSHSGKVVLFEGDGSFQVTCQAISDILRNELDVAVFILNNKGYTYERWLNGMKAEYNDVPNWEYTKAPEFFGGKEEPVAQTRRIETMDELSDVVEHEHWHYPPNDSCLRIYDVIMDPEDVPEKSKAGLLAASEALRSG